MFIIIVGAHDTKIQGKYIIFYYHHSGGARTQPPPTKNCAPEFPYGKSQVSALPSAMREPPPGGTAFMITVTSTPSKLTHVQFPAPFYSTDAQVYCGFDIVHHEYNE